MTDWPLHNLDLSNTRYSPLDAINTSNAGRLAVTWSFDAGMNLGEVTPLVVNGVMYFNAGSKLFAVNAATGAATAALLFAPAIFGRLAPEEQRNTARRAWVAPPPRLRPVRRTPRSENRRIASARYFAFARAAGSGSPTGE